jgi:hypothetical protein
VYNIKRGRVKVYNNMQEVVHVNEKEGMEGGKSHGAVVQSYKNGSTVDEWLQADRHLNTLFAFAFDHTGHGDGGYSQDRFPFRE